MIPDSITLPATAIAYTFVQDPDLHDILAAEDMMRVHPFCANRSSVLPEAREGKHDKLERKDTEVGAGYEVRIYC